MSRISLETDFRKYPPIIKKHLDDSMIDRRWQFSMGVELKEWLRTSPVVPDLVESPQGWYKAFQTFTAHGEGKYIKTVGTRFEPIRPRPAKGGLPKEVNLDEWMGKRKSLDDARTKEELNELWGQASPEEKAEYTATHRRASLKLALAALEPVPNPLDMDMRNIGNSPADLDLKGSI